MRLRPHRLKAPKRMSFHGIDLADWAKSASSSWLWCVNISNEQSWRPERIRFFCNNSAIEWVQGINISSVDSDAGRPLCMQVFRHVVKQSLSSAWLGYPHSFCNRSSQCNSTRIRHKSPSSSSNVDDVRFLLPSHISAFARFLRMHNVKRIESWHTRFSEKSVSVPTIFRSDIHILSFKIDFVYVDV